MPNPIKIENTRDIIEFEIEGKIYKVPLATGLQRSELKKLNTEDNMEEFFSKYLGKEVWNGLTVGAQNQIAQAWAKEAEKASGLKLGE